MALKNWRELKALNELKQKGYDIGEENDQKYFSNDFTPIERQEENDAINAYLSATPRQKAAQSKAGAGEYFNLLEQIAKERSGEQGYGASQYDTVPYEVWRQNPVDYRANAQSAGSKFVNGVAKMIPYAITTAMDNTVGIFTGAANILYDAFDGGDFSPSNSFINNAFSRAMQDVRDWSERVLPNYRTQEEVDDQDRWWKHLNANFWGDTFVKNLGFTIGAMIGGTAWAKAFRMGMGKLANKAYKAATAAALEGDVAAEQAFQKILQGQAMGDVGKIYDTFSNLHKSYKTMNAMNQFIMGTFGSFGESRVEAIGAASEFRDQALAAANQRYQEAKAKLEEEMMSDDNNFDEIPEYDGYGRETGRTQKVFKASAREIMNGRLKKIQDDYMKERSLVDEQARRVANTTFWLNMPVLTGSNIIFFGKMMSGGYKSQAKIKVKGTFGNYKATGSIGKGVVEGLKTTLSEGGEELTQKIISEGAKSVASSNMAAFHNGKYDEYGMKTTGEWLMGVLNNAGDVLVDPKSWQEFAVGALTGLLGMPSRFGIKNWQGGLIGGIQQAKAERDQSRDLAKKLNERAQSNEFKEFWKGYVRHNKYERIKDIALNSELPGVEGKMKDENGEEVGSKFVWKTADDAQMLSDVMMFANTGRLQDLEDFVDSFADITIDDINKMGLMDDTDPDFNKKSDEQKVQWVKDRAYAAKKAIRQYRDFHEAIDFLTLGTSDPDVVDELVYTQAQLQNFEDRYNKLLDEVIARVRPTIENVAKEKDAKGNPTKRAEIAQQLLASEEDMRSLFGGFAEDIKGRGQDKNGLNPITQMFVELDNDRQESVFQRLEEWGAFAGKDTSLKQDVKDLQALVRARQNYYAKLFDPSFRTSFKASAHTDEEEEKKLVDSATQERTKKNFELLKKATNIKEFYNIVDNIHASYGTEGMPKEDWDALMAEVKKDPALNRINRTIDIAESNLRKLKKNAKDMIGIATDTEIKNGYQRIIDTIDHYDLKSVLSDMPDGEDSALYVSRDMYNAFAGDPVAQDLLYNMLTELYGAEAIASKFGKRPGPATTGPTPAPAPTPGSTPAPTPAPTPGPAPAPTTGPSSAPAPGPAPVTPPSAPASGGTGGTAGGTGTGGSGSVSSRAAVDSKLNELDGITDINDTNLNNILNGNYSSIPFWDSLSMEEQQEIIDKARQVRDRLNEDAGSVAGEEDPDAVKENHDNLKDGGRNSEARKRARKDRAKRQIESIDATKNYQIYNDKKLPDGMAVEDSTDPVKAVSNRVVGGRRWMKEHNVQKFIDSGALSELREKYMAAHKQELPIFILNNPHFTGNYATNPFAYKNSNGNINRLMLFAVEMNDENTKFLKKYKDAGVFSDSSLVEVLNADGTVTKYQVVGCAYGPTESDIDAFAANNGPEFQEPYSKVRTAYTDMYDATIGDSILTMYQQDKEKAGSSYPADGRFYAARVSTGTNPVYASDGTTVLEEKPTFGRRVFTTINYMMSGRNETRDENGVSTKIPLSESLQKDNFTGEVHFALHTLSEGIVKSTGAPEFPESFINAPYGSLWMATRQPNGDYGWTYITVVSADKYDFNANKDSALISGLYSALDSIFAPAVPAASEKEKREDFKKRHEGVRTLTDIFYFGDGNKVQVMFSGGSPMLVIGDAVCDSPQVVLQHLKDIKARFQVNRTDVTNEQNMNMLIDANVLTSEMRSFVRKGASVGMNFLITKDDQGNHIDPKPASSRKSVVFGRGTEVTYTDAKEGRNIWIGTTNYTLHADGSVWVGETAKSSGTKVHDRYAVSTVKAIHQAIEDSKNGETDGFWSIQDENQYTMMCEKSVDGVRVRLVKEGKNTAWKLVSSDRHWEDLMQIAEPLGGAKYSANPTRQTGQSNAPTTEEQKEYENTPAENPAPGKITFVDNDGIDDDFSGLPSVPTVEEAIKDDSRDEVKNDCGSGSLPV